MDTLGAWVTEVVTGQWVCHAAGPEGLLFHKNRQEDGSLTDTAFPVNSLSNPESSRASKLGYGAQRHT